MPEQRNPMQPVIVAPDGRIRFKGNQIVRDLLDAASAGTKLDLNDIAMLEYSQEGRCQLAQLIGYSISGYHELSYVSDRHAAEASAAAKLINPEAGGCRDDGCNIHSGVKEGA